MVIFLTIVGIALLLATLAAENAQAIERGWSPLWKLLLGGRADTEPANSVHHQRQSDNELLSVAHSVDEGEAIVDLDFGGLDTDLTDLGLASIDIFADTTIDDDELRAPLSGGTDHMGVLPATKLDLARAYVDMGDPDGAREILEELLDESEKSQTQATKLLARIRAESQ